MRKKRWSKNITEEGNNPEQIVLGSMDKHLYLLLNLLLYLHSDFLFDRPDSRHQIIQKQHNNIFEGDIFNKVNTQKQLKLKITSFTQFLCTIYR